ncbi:MAG: permease prefix domain 1-containing protein [Oscillospiraceae bacterium]|nr:permease prefix domain 1-containing protein [Oscillospiraceae bacterium]
MEAIKTYLNNVFAAFPQNEQIIKLKSEMLADMEEKYHALKKEGKSENEAVGNVIANFGSIDEITAELGLTPAEEKDDNSIYLTRDKAIEYLEQTKKSGFGLGIGVWLIMIGVALMLLIGGVDAAERPGDIINTVKESVIKGEGDFQGAMGVFVLLMFIAGAVPIFIVNGLKIARYESFERSRIKLDAAVQSEIEQLDAKFNSRFAMQIAGGVVLILFAVGLFILFGVMVGDRLQVVLLSVMLILIGFSVFMFITAGMLKSAYDKLLGKGDYTFDYKKNYGKMERIIGTIAAFFWPLIVAAYLLWSFIWDAWNISWAIWPIAGLIFGAISGAIGAYYSIGDDNK